MVLPGGHEGLNIGGFSGDPGAKNVLVKLPGGTDWPGSIAVSTAEQTTVGSSKETDIRV